MKISIQPTISTFKKYAHFAEQENLDFEIVDFAFPSTINSDTNPIVQKYRLCLEGRTEHLTMHGPFMDLYIHSPDNNISKVAKERILECLEVATELNVQAVVFHTNSLPMIERQSYYDNWVDTNAIFWSEMIEKFDLTILLENMWDKSPDLLLGLIKKVNSPKLRVCLDTGHCNVFSKVNIREWFESLGEYIAYIHVNDNKGDGDFELPIGDGSIDWKLFSQLASTCCPDARVVIEMSDLDAIRKSMDFMKANNVFPYVTQR